MLASPKFQSTPQKADKNNNVQPENTQLLDKVTNYVNSHLSSFTDTQITTPYYEINSTGFLIYIYKKKKLFLSACTFISIAI